MPAAKKPSETLRRRNAPELWTVLPAAGCKLPPPKWPMGGKPSPAEADLWRRLWKLPVASWWHEQRIEPSVVARYVTLAIEKPSLAVVGALERDLGLTPAGMARLRLVVEQPEPEKQKEADPYAALKRKRGVK